MLPPRLVENILGEHTLMENTVAGIKRFRRSPLKVLDAVGKSHGFGSRPHGVFDVGLIGSYDSAERRTEVASLVWGWTCQLRGCFRDVAVEVVS